MVTNKVALADSNAKYCICHTSNVNKEKKLSNVWLVSSIDVVKHDKENV